MAIELQTIQDLQARIANDLILAVNAGQLDTSKHIDPSIRNSAIKGLVNSMAAGFDENNDILSQLLLQLFPQTATGEYLERWASFFGITRKIAVAASGNVVFTGVATTSIPAGTLLQKADGTEFSTGATASIATSNISITSITRSGQTATVTTASDHNLATGTIIDSISGAGQSEYNLSNITITVIASNQFTYTVSGSPVTPATGTIIATITTANISVSAVEVGIVGNSDNGSELTLVSPIVDVDNSSFVAFGGLTGGLDIETDEALRTRLQERTANFTAPFTTSGLPIFIKEKNSGITRIWIEDATPSAGYVTIYFMKDNQSGVPSAAEVLAVKNTIIDADTGIKPANTPDSYVVVSAPTAVPVNFTFSALSPNTTAMRTAITQSLTDFFKSDLVNVGEDVIQNEYNNAIFSTLDASGNQPTFTLSAPSGTVAIATGELATLGTITF